jgi:hypothetical protein
MMTSMNRLSVVDGSNNNSNNNSAGNPLTSTTLTSTTTGKKKFGKNLNKLTKPPAPPAASENSKANAASRNGLLLLSTNKRNSGSGPSNGLLASKPSVTTPLPSLGLQYESSTSTHDVLLGAVVGAAAYRAEQTPDAWGVAAAASNQNINNNDTTIATPLVEEPKKEPREPTERFNPSESSRPISPPREQQPQQPVMASSNWDEYGGRDASAGSRGLVNMDRPSLAQNNGSSSVEPIEDSQQVYMAKLARERAERRRQEEATRANDQKEKAAQRLRALESKMEDYSSNKASDRKGVILEPLGGNSASNNSNNNSSTPVLASRPVQRTLYDPNQGSSSRTYSSLLGGANGVHDAKNSGAASVSSDQKSLGRGSGELSPRAVTTTGAYGGPVIHLNSYEDRDRGEAPRAAAPRMLFDPKSGSMVAVTSRDDNPRGVKIASGKGRGRGRNKSADDESVNARIKKPEPKGKTVKKSKVAGKTSAKASKTNPHAERKLPRTRGVLYTRDEKGNCNCADGCDGDLGYGAHSVPGGRVRNPDAYETFIEQQQPSYNEQESPSADRQRSNSSERHDAYHEHHSYNPYEATEDMGYDEGYSLMDHSAPEEQEVTQPVLDWVKPNEKIELVTGMDDESPTLQATARAWAPSQAALAAAAKAAVMPSLGSRDDEDEMSTPGLKLKPSLEPRDQSSASKVLMSMNMSEDEDDDDDVPVSNENRLRLCLRSPATLAMLMS